MQFGVQFQLLSLPRLIQVAATITFALVLRSYWALLAGMIVRAFARVTVSYMFHPHRPRFRLQGWRELAGFSFWTWATALAIMVWNRCDPFILGPALGPTNLGLYLLALELGTLPVTELIQPVADALFVGFASAQHDGVSSTRFAPLVVGRTVSRSATSGYRDLGGQRTHRHASVGAELGGGARLAGDLAFGNACSPPSASSARPCWSPTATSGGTSSPI